MQGANMQVDR